MKQTAFKESHKTTFGENVRTGTELAQRPECNGEFTTNAAETDCKDCDLVVAEQRMDCGPEFRLFVEEERERTGA